MTAAFPEPRLLTRHQPPALMVAELLDVTATGGRTRLSNPDGLDALQLAEGCAQSVAVVIGHARREQGADPSNGMLVAMADAVMIRSPLPGEAVEISVEQQHSWSSLRSYRASAVTTDGTQVFSGDS